MPTLGLEDFRRDDKGRRSKGTKEDRVGDYEEKGERRKEKERGGEAKAREGDKKSSRDIREKREVKEESPERRKSKRSRGSSLEPAGRVHEPEKGSKDRKKKKRDDDPDSPEKGAAARYERSRSRDREDMKDKGRSSKPDKSRRDSSPGKKPDRYGRSHEVNEKQRARHEDERDKRGSSKKDKSGPGTERRGRSRSRERGDKSRRSVERSEDEQKMERDRGRSRSGDRGRDRVRRDRKDNRRSRSRDRGDRHRSRERKEERGKEERGKEERGKEERGKEERGRGTKHDDKRDKGAPDKKPRDDNEAGGRGEARKDKGEVKHHHRRSASEELETYDVRGTINGKASGQGASDVMRDQGHGLISPSPVDKDSAPDKPLSPSPAGPDRMDEGLPNSLGGGSARMQVDGDDTQEDHGAPVTGDQPAPDGLETSPSGAMRAESEAVPNHEVRGSGDEDSAPNTTRGGESKAAVNEVDHQQVHLHLPGPPSLPTIMAPGEEDASSFEARWNSAVSSAAQAGPLAAIPAPNVEDKKDLLDAVEEERRHSGSRGKRSRWDAPMAGGQTTKKVPDELSKLNALEVEAQLRALREENNLLLQQMMQNNPLSAALFGGGIPPLSDAPQDVTLPPELLALKEREREKKERQKRLQEELRARRAQEALSVDQLFEADFDMRPVAKKGSTATAGQVNKSTGVDSTQQSVLKLRQELDNLHSCMLSEEEVLKWYHQHLGVAGGDYSQASNDLKLTAKMAILEERQYLLAKLATTDPSFVPPPDYTGPMGQPAEASVGEVLSSPKSVESSAQGSLAKLPSVKSADMKMEAAEVLKGKADVDGDKKKTFVVIKKNNLIPQRRAVYKPPQASAKAVETFTSIPVGPPVAGALKGPGAGGSKAKEAPDEGPQADKQEETGPAGATSPFVPPPIPVLAKSGDEGPAYEIGKDEDDEAEEVQVPPPPPPGAPPPPPINTSTAIKEGSSVGSGPSQVPQQSNPPPWAQQSSQMAMSYGTQHRYPAAAGTVSQSTNQSQGAYVPAQASYGHGRGGLHAGDGFGAQPSSYMGGQMQAPRSGHPNPYGGGPGPGPPTRGSMAMGPGGPLGAQQFSGGPFSSNMSPAGMGGYGGPSDHMQWGPGGMPMSGPHGHPGMGPGASPYEYSQGMGPQGGRSYGPGGPFYRGSGYDPYMPDPPFGPGPPPMSMDHYGGGPMMGRPDNYPGRPPGMQRGYQQGPRGFPRGPFSPESPLGPPPRSHPPRFPGPPNADYGPGGDGHDWPHQGPNFYESPRRPPGPPGSSGRPYGDRPPSQEVPGPPPPPPPLVRSSDDAERDDHPGPGHALGRSVSGVEGEEGPGLEDAELPGGQDAQQQTNVQSPSGASHPPLVILSVSSPGSARRSESPGAAGFSRPWPQVHPDQVKPDLNGEGSPDTSTPVSSPKSRPPPLEVPAASQEMPLPQASDTPGAPNSQAPGPGQSPGSPSGQLQGPPEHFMPAPTGAPGPPRPPPRPRDMSDMQEMVKGPLTPREGPLAPGPYSSSPEAPPPPSWQAGKHPPPQSLSQGPPHGPPMGPPMRPLGPHPLDCHEFPQGPGPEPPGRHWNFPRGPMGSGPMPGPPMGNLMDWQGGMNGPGGPFPPPGMGPMIEGPPMWGPRPPPGPGPPLEMMDPMGRPRPWGGGW